MVPNAVFHFWQTTELNKIFENYNKSKTEKSIFREDFTSIVIHYNTTNFKTDGVTFTNTHTVVVVVIFWQGFNEILHKRQRAASPSRKRQGRGGGIATTFWCMDGTPHSMAVKTFEITKGMEQPHVAWWKNFLQSTECLCLSEARVCACIHCVFIYCVALCIHSLRFVHSVVCGSACVGRGTEGVSIGEHWGEQKPDIFSGRHSQEKIST